MKAFVINLKRRKDRLDHITKECKRVGLDMVLVEAVDGKVDFPEENPRIIQAAFGCYESHRKVLKLIKESGESGLIIEDDNIFCEKFWEEFSKRAEELPNDYDIYFLGGSLLLDNAIEDYSKHLRKAKSVLCTNAYLVNINSVDKLLKKVEEKRWKIDVIYTEFQQNNNCYISYPPLCWQLEGWSDLVDARTNNLHLRYGRN